MGRQVRRVPMDFDHPLDQVWKGFLNPYADYSIKCNCCHGQCYNKATRELDNTFYDNDGFANRWSYKYENGHAVAIVESYPGACRRWEDKITQDETDMLVEEHRVAGTHVFNEDTKQWIRIPGRVVTAEMINAQNVVGAKSLGHDAINRMLLVRHRAKRLGVYGYCETCDGKGRIITSRYLKKLYDEWEPTPPPTGDGWQVWETVSEGSPITPVFATAKELIDYIVNEGMWSKKYTREAATAFVLEKKYVPSVTVKDGEFL